MTVPPGLKLRWWAAYGLAACLSFVYGPAFAILAFVHFDGIGLLLPAYYEFLDGGLRIRHIAWTTLHKTRRQFRHARSQPRDRDD